MCDVEQMLFRLVIGVPKGSVLGLLLFTINDNDLPSNVTNPMLFADDIKIFRLIQNDTDCI